MNEKEFTIDCWAFFGNVNWSIESVYEYITSAKRIYELFGAKETHYGFSETPHGTVKGAHIGSARNVIKKVEAIYSKEAKLKTLEFFSLPKNYNYQYGEYGIYLARSKDFMVIGYDTEMFSKVPIETILSEMKAQMIPVWGEHFQITKGNQPYVYCMDRFEKNMTGNNLVCDMYVEKLQPIYIVEQFKR
ncbi:MAG: hypothetical protein IKY30_03345 [Oscillospiraceae bacterium]|nr:hypothetical protein [Oscillospiraceae bacterium]